MTRVPLMIRTLRTAVVVSVAAALACGCADGPLVAELVGTWEWTGTSGGIAGDTRLPGPDDPRVTVEFVADGTARFRRDGEVAREQRFRLVREATIYDADPLPVLYFDDEDLGRVVRISADGERLSLSDNVYDGFSLEYRRVRP